MIFRGRHEDGDTLVEVILAIALMSLVLVSAFNIIGSSYRTAMLSKERLEAVSLAQQQAERLRKLRDDTLASGQPFTAVAFPNDGQILDPGLNVENCGGACVKGLYRITLDQQNSSIAGISTDLMKVFVIRVEWTQVGTTDINNTEIIFKLADRNANNVVRDCAVVESCT